MNDERLLVGFAHDPILVYDTAALFSSTESVQPIHTFPPGNSGVLRQIISNPGDLPEQVAVRRDMDGDRNGVPVAVLDVKNLQPVGGWRSGGSIETTPSAINWSARGKQLAIGLQAGDVYTFVPGSTADVKLHFPKPAQAGNHGLTSVSWLSNSVFHLVYAENPSNPSSDQKHFIISYDQRSNYATDIELTTPCFPSPGLRPPGPVSVVLRNWNNGKFLIFTGDGPSSDIALIGCLGDPVTGEETWSNLSLEETSTPSLPLDAQSNDTALLGLDLDVCNTQKVKSGDET